MKLENLDINEILRFVVTGLSVYFVFSMSNIKIDFIETDFEKVILIVMFGIVVYFLYRSMLYPLILQLLDKMNTKNVRYFLKSKFDISKWDEANDLWHIICKTVDNLEVDRLRTWSHSIHMLFILCIVSFVRLIINIIIKDCTNVLIFLGLSLLFLLSSISSDLSLEKRIYRNFVFNYTEKIDEIVNKYKENNKEVIK